MSTKMKGLLKGLRYISHIFEEEKEPEMQIGFPTDVKHVAHIGWDGPSVDSPSWMNQYKTPGGGYQSAPLTPPPDSKQNPEIKWVSEDAKGRSGSRRVPDSPGREPTSEMVSPRRESLADGAAGSSTGDPPVSRESSTKSRHSRRQHSKDSCEGSMRGSSRHLQPDGSEAAARQLPDIPRKTRRKKSKDSVGAPTKSNRSSKGNNSSVPYASPFSDPGPVSDSSLSYKGDELSQISSLKSIVESSSKEKEGDEFS